MVDNQGHCLTCFQRKMLLKSLESNLRPEYRRRIEIMLRADMGQSQAQICEELHCSQETARYWMSVAFSGNAHLWNDKPMGRPKTVNEEYLDRLKELVSRSPREYGYPFKRWTAQWLRKHLAKELGIEVGDRHMNRLLKNLGLSTRSQPEKTEQAIEIVNGKTSSFTIQDLPYSLSQDFIFSLDLSNSNN